MITLERNLQTPAERSFEVVERKGLGHPDTLSDSLAEHLSVAYCRHTLDHFGAILRHQFDKAAIMCGRARVSFGDGELIEPIRVLLNGRASARLGDSEIPVRELVLDTARSFFKLRFPDLDPDRDFRYIFEVRHGAHSTTGGIFGDPASNDAAVHYRFDPRTLADLPESSRPEANDTSLGCAWSGPTALERTVLAIEQSLNTAPGQTLFPWLGADVKVMGVRRGRRLSFVVAAPIRARLTKDPVEYFERTDVVRGVVLRVATEACGDFEIDEVVVNSGDDVAKRKLYMNLTGSSIESGDEGVVGRGNRIGGLIAPGRPMTMEGIGGKNPRYHLGKLYCAAAWDIAQRLETRFGGSAHVHLVNRMGEALGDAWRAHVEIVGHMASEAEVADTVGTVMADLEGVTGRILEGRYPLF